MITQELVNGLALINLTYNAQDRSLGALWKTKTFPISRMLSKFSILLKTGSLMWCGNGRNCCCRAVCVGVMLFAH